MASVDAADEVREPVTDEFATTADEDGRATGEACAVLLATPRGGTPEPAALRGDAAANRHTAGARRIVEAVAAEKSVQKI